MTLPELHLQQKLNVVPQDIGSSLTTKNAINIVWGVSEVASEVAFTYVSVDSSRTVLEHHRPSHMQSGPQDTTSVTSFCAPIAINECSLTTMKQPPKTKLFERQAALTETRRNNT